MKNGTGSFPKWQQFMKTSLELYLPGLSDSQRLSSKFVLLLQNIASLRYLLSCTHLAAQTSLITKPQSSRAPLGHWAAIKEKRHECWLCFISVAATVTRAADVRTWRASLLYFVGIFCKSTLFWCYERLFFLNVSIQQVNHCCIHMFGSRSYVTPFDCSSAYYFKNVRKYPDPSAHYPLSLSVFLHVLLWVIFVMLGKWAIN